MMAPTYIEANLLQRRERQRSLQFHQQRLQDIKHRHSNSSHEIKQTRTPSVPMQRWAEIERSNKLLMQKLLHIASRKPLTRPSLSPNSLNQVTRRRKLQDISLENLRLARRIGNANGVVSVRILEQQYRDIRRYRNIGSRMRLIEAGNKANCSVSGSRFHRLSPVRAASSVDLNPV